MFNVSNNQTFLLLLLLRYINFTLELTEKSVQFISVWSVFCSFVLIGALWKFYQYFSSSSVVLNILRFGMLNFEVTAILCHEKWNWRSYIIMPREMKGTQHSSAQNKLEKHAGCLLPCGCNKHCNHVQFFWNHLTSIKNGINHRRLTWLGWIKWRPYQWHSIFGAY